jgi:hypothetical protein
MSEKELKLIAERLYRTPGDSTPVQEWIDLCIEAISSQPVEQWNSAWCWKEIDRLTLALKQSEAHRDQMSREICEDGVKLENLRDENERLRKALEKIERGGQGLSLKKIVIEITCF